MCITTCQPHTKSDPNPNPNPNPTTKRHAIVNIQLTIVACPTYPDKFIQDILCHTCRCCQPLLLTRISCDCQSLSDRLLDCWMSSPRVVHVAAVGALNCVRTQQNRALHPTVQSRRRLKCPYNEMTLKQEKKQFQNGFVSV